MPRKTLNKRHIMMIRWGIPTVLVTGGLTAAAWMMSGREDPAAANPDGSIDGLTSILERDITDAMVQFTFADVGPSLGVQAVHFPDTRQSLLPEDMGSGAAWGDYDNDGDIDLFLVNFSASINTEPNDASDAGRSHLYRNDGASGFTDVSLSSGLGIKARALAAEWADFDNDGALDLYISCYGTNMLMRNNTDGTFTDVTAEAGVGDESFSAGCSWADYDRDGWLDLYVCNYVNFTRNDDGTERRTRQYGSEIPYTINPSAYPPATNRLYRNNGDGTFTDRGVPAGVDNPGGRSLEASWFDFDHDGWIDLYVANDVSANGVFRNMGDGTFSDIGASSLAADYRGAMGLATGDYDHDGDLDIFVTHWLAQENALYMNRCTSGSVDSEGNPRLFFMDEAEMLGLGHISLKTVGWAAGFVDFDNDGNTDLWVANGNTLERDDDHSALKPQLTHVFRRDSERGYFEIGTQSCDALAVPMVGRGGAMADFDNDGLVDLLICRHGDVPLLLRNTTDNDHHWLRLDLRQPELNRFAVGARVEVVAGDLQLGAQVGADASYLSQHEYTLHFGLGRQATVDSVSIFWPDGTSTVLTDVAVDQVHTIMQDR